MSKEGLRVTGSGKTITVYVPHEVAYDLEKIQRVQAALVNRLGHTTCYSGYDIYFKQEEIYSVNARTLDLNPVGHTAG